MTFSDPHAPRLAALPLIEPSPVVRMRPALGALGRKNQRLNRRRGRSGERLEVVAVRLRERQRGAQL
jgi:hypothetical protein